MITERSVEFKSRRPQTLAQSLSVHHPTTFKVLLSKTAGHRKHQKLNFWHQKIVKYQHFYCKRNSVGELKMDKFAPVPSALTPKHRKKKKTRNDRLGKSNSSYIISNHRSERESIANSARHRTLSRWPCTCGVGTGDSQHYLGDRVRVGSVQGIVNII